MKEKEIMCFYFALVEQVEEHKNIMDFYKELTLKLHKKYQPVDLSSFNSELMTFLHAVNVRAYKKNYISRDIFEKILEDLPLE